MKLTEDILNTIQKYAREGFSSKYIAALLKLDPELFSGDTPASRYFAIGREEMRHQDKGKIAAKEEMEASGTANSKRRVAYTELTLQYEYRRAFSEVQLLDAMNAEGFHFTDGKCYVFISNGDVDSLSFLKAVLMQQNLHHLVCSTWCMACQDILQIQQWCDSGKIEKMDFYLGEIFKGSYFQEYTMMKELYEKRPDLGRMAIFRNHSKIFSGTGDRFSFSIMSSANINTNPRCENTCIIISEESYRFFKAFFDDIKSFE